MHIEGASVDSLEVSSLSIVRRPSDEEPDPGLGGALGVWMQAPVRVGGIVRFASRLSQIDSPGLRVAHVSVSRDGGSEPELELAGLEAAARETGAPVEISIEQLTLASSQGPLGVSATPRLRAVHVEADAMRGTLEGAIDATLAVPLLGTLRLGALTGEQRVRVTGEQLDGEARWSVALE